MKNVLFIAVISMLLIACKPKGDYKAFTTDPILYSKTVKKLNNIVLENNFPPMIGARNYVYANIAAFECCPKNIRKHILKIRFFMSQIN